MSGALRFEMEFWKPVILEAQVLFEVDYRSNDPQPFAGDRHGGVRDPETDGALDHVFFAQGAVTCRGLDLGIAGGAARSRPPEQPRRK